MVGGTSLAGMGRQESRGERREKRESKRAEGELLPSSYYLKQSLFLSIFIHEIQPEVSIIS